MTLWLTDSAARDLIDHARAEAPNEACGVLLGSEVRVERAVPVSNTAADPRHHYHMDERELARLIGGRDGLALVGFYHSHPNGDPIPSPTDVAQATYPGTPYLIVGLGGSEARLAAWTIDYGRVNRLPLHVGDQPPPDDSPPLSPAARIALLTSALIAFILMIVVSLSLLPPAPSLPR